LALDPNNVAALRNLGQILHFTGRSEAGIPLIEKALRLSPRDAGIGFGLLNLGGSYMVVGRTDEALVELRKAVAALPQIFYAHLSLAGALGLRGFLDDAKAEIAESLKLRPEVNSLSKWRENLRAAGLGHPAWLAQLDKTAFEGLRRAGFPEE
jgi:tetratricopeptide (TPR) repeat protein